MLKFISSNDLATTEGQLYLLIAILIGRYSPGRKPGQAPIKGHLTLMLNISASD